MPSSGWPTDSQASLEVLCFIVSSGCFCLFVCLFNLTDPLCIYYGFQVCVFMDFLCMHMCMSPHPYVFLVLFFFDTFFLFGYFVLFQFLLFSVFFLSPFYYYSLDEGETERGSGGGTGRGIRGETTI